MSEDKESGCLGCTSCLFMIALGAVVLSALSLILWWLPILLIVCFVGIVLIDSFS